jgi:hypothetical protein
VARFAHTLSESRLPMPPGAGSSGRALASLGRARVPATAAPRRDAVTRTRDIYPQSTGGLRFRVKDPVAYDSKGLNTGAHGTKTDPSVFCTDGPGAKGL